MTNLFEKALASEGVTGKLAELAKSIYLQESSGGKNTKTSNAGAKGGMQVMPGTFGEVADKGWKIDDPEHNARAGIRYLKKLDVLAGGDPALTAAGYYGGPGGLAKAKQGIAVSDPRNPNAPNTLEYGKQVAGRLKAAPSTVLAKGEVVPVAPAMAAGAPMAMADGPVEMPEAPQLQAMPTGGNAWLNFLASMPKDQATVKEGDLSYGDAQVNVPAFSLGRSQGRKPNFEAFKGWLA